MGQREDENPTSEDETKPVPEPEREKLRPDPPEEMELTKIPIKTRDGHPEVIVGHSDPFFKTSHLKCLLYAFNFFVVVLGVVLLAIAIWIRVDPELWEYETTLNVDNFHAVCTMLIVAALVILIVGVIGCVGAVSEQRWLLILYICLLGLIFLIELIAIILLFVAPFSSSISSNLERKILKQIENRQDDDSSRYFVDFIQEHLHCCGASSVRDYGAVEAPPSCQDPETGKVFTRGCVSKMLTYLRSKAGIIGGVSLPILVIQLFALAVTITLVRRMAVDSRYFLGEGRF